MYILSQKNNFTKIILVFLFLIIGKVDFCYAILNVESTDKVLISRDSYLSRIRNLFKNDESLVVLCGASGVGKTQLSKSYIEKYATQYEIVWWFNSNGNLFDQLKKFARELNKLGVVKIAIEIDQTSLEYLTYQVKEALWESSKKWLLVFDDVSDYDSIKDLIFYNKDKKNGHIIISSKNEFGWKNVIPIKKFNRNESIELIKKITSIDQDVDKLAELFDDYPLAISQAATFIKITGIPNFQDYISLFKTSREKLWKKEEKIYVQSSQLHDVHKTIHTTMEMSLNNLKQKSLSSYKLYKCIGLLHKKGMYSELVNEIYVLLNEGVQNDDSIQKDINFIISEGLLDRDSNNGGIEFSRHEMFQYAIEDFISDSERKQFLKIIAQAITKLTDLNWDKLVEYISKQPNWTVQAEHLLKTAEKFSFIDENIIKIKIRLLEYNIYHIRDHKLYEEQISNIEDSLKNVSISDVERAKFYIDSVYNRKMYENRDNKTAEKNMKWAVDVLKKSGDQNEYFRSLFNMANFYLFINKIETALVILNEAESMKDSIKSKSYLNLFFYVYGWILFENGEYARSYEYIRSFLGNHETNTGSSLKLLSLTLAAECLLKKGDIVQAAKFSNQAIDGSKKLYQNEKSEVMALSLVVLAQCYKEQKKLSEAECLLKKAKDVYRDYWGGSNRHPDQSNAYVILGDIYQSKGQFDAAMEEYIDAEKILDSVADDKKIPRFSIIYQKIYYLALKMKKESKFNTYFKKHKDTFGLQNDETLKMAQDLPS